jgi:recombination protein RecA
VKRIALDAKAQQGLYFAGPKKNLKFIPSGCLTLDLALGGGWAENRIANVVGDKSSGKTLLAIEASANFAKKYPKGWIYYRECEAAFDPDYAAALGMPLDRVDFGEPFDTVDDLYKDLDHTIAKASTPVLYIVDSLDSLSDDAEMQLDISEGTYGTGKAKKMSQMFRRLVRKMSSSNITLMIISQVRSKIGAVSFGRQTTRSGGRALDFYASQVLYLSYIKPINRNISNLKRAAGIKIRSKVEKNKIALPFRGAEFDILFGYGIDDLGSCVDWLRECKSLDRIGLSEAKVKDFLVDLKKSRNYEVEAERIHKAVTTRWYEIEQRFLPTRKKYG